MLNLLLRLFYFAPLFLVIGTVNYSLDPAHIFNHNYQNELVEALQEGKHLVNLGNHNARIFHKKHIKTNEQKSEVVVMGSSRSMTINQQHFPNQSFFNYSMSNGNLEDYMSLLFLMKQKKQLPTSLVLCLDTWLLGNTFQDPQWQVLMTHYKGFCKEMNQAKPERLPVWKEQKSKLQELFSAKYFLESLKTYDNKNIILSDTIHQNKMMKLADGSRKHANWIYEQPKKVVANKAMRYCGKSKDELFVEVDTEKIQKLATLFDFLKKEKINVLVFIPPYHPKAFDFYKNNSQYSGLFEAETQLKKLCQVYKFSVIGSNDPAIFELTEKDFYDGTHIKRDKINELDFDF